MARPEPHPQLIKSFEQAVGKIPAITLGGFIAPSPRGIVRLCPTLSNSNEYVDIPESAVLQFEQDDETGVTELTVDASTVVTGVATRSYSLLTHALRRRDDSPDGGPGGEKSCVEKRIEACKKDPMRNPEFCDSDKARNLFDSLCEIFGDPQHSSGGIFIA